MNESSFTSGLHVSLGFQQSKVIPALAQSSSCKGNLCLHHAKRDVLRARENIFKQNSPVSLQGQKIPALRRTSNRLEFDLQQGTERTRPKRFSLRCPPPSPLVWEGPSPWQRALAHAKEAGRRSRPCRSKPPPLRTRAGSPRYGLTLGACRRAQRLARPPGTPRPPPSPVQPGTRPARRPGRPHSPGRARRRAWRKRTS